MIRTMSIWITALAMAFGLAACDENPSSPEADVQSETTARYAGGIGTGTCMQIRATGAPVANGPYSFQGPAALTVDGVAQGPALVTTWMTGEIKPPPGAMHATTSHIFEVGVASPNGVCEAGEDCFVTQDRAVLSPRGAPTFFNLNSQMTVVMGHGLFAGPTSSQMKATGTLDFAPPFSPPVASWEIKGNLCTGS
jgi:hypothetical protein